MVAMCYHSSILPPGAGHQDVCRQLDKLIAHFPQVAEVYHESHHHRLATVQARLIRDVFAGERRAVHWALSVLGRDRGYGPPKKKRKRRRR